jgi:hypothetical protein
MTAAILLALATAVPVPAPAGEPLPATIVRIVLPEEQAERRPIAVPTAGDDAVEVDFPWALEDWAGRGFTPDPEKFAGDFVIDAGRGRTRLFVTPVTPAAHRILHVVLAAPGGGTRSVSLEFLPAPAGLGWAKVVLTAPIPAPLPPRIALSPAAPRTRLREASAEAQIGFLSTLRLLANLTAVGARGMQDANPSLAVSYSSREARSFGGFSIQCLFAASDSTTGSLGLCARISNLGATRLLFDPMSWVARVGDRVYPLRTVDFAGELEPGAAADAFLVLGRGPGGEATRLSPDNEFEVSVALAGSVNPRPVSRMKLEGFEP